MEKMNGGCKQNIALRYLNRSEFCMKSGLLIIRSSLVEDAGFDSKLPHPFSHLW